jgi:hypothetical protein
MHPGFTRLFILAALLSASCAATAAECVYRAKSADARLVRFSGEMLAPRGWTVDQQCEHLEVVTGTFRVVAPGAAGKLAESDVSSGTLVSREQGGGTALMRQIAIVLAGDERVRSGMSRAGGNFDPLAEALPSGQVVDHGRALDIVFPDAAAAKSATLQLATAGRAPLRVPVVDGVARLPASYLRSGAAYQWRLAQGGTTLQGTFTMVSESVYAQTRAAINDELGAADPDGLRTLAVADRLAARGYLLEARTLASAYFH